MKTYKLFPAFIFTLFIGTALFAQTAKKETIKVNGECGMCKKKIEKAAKANGATIASWSPETKVLQVSYNPKKTSSDKIQKAIAAVGYDTEKYPAANDAYDNLDECCKYERKAADTKDVKKACCEDGKAGKECKHQDGSSEKCCDMDKCGKDKDTCKDMACCKDKEMKCCKHEGHGSK